VNKTNQTPERADLVITFLQQLPPPLAEAVRAAAVPHLLDAPLLAALLEIEPSQARDLCRTLEEMPFVQTLGHDDQYTLHETVRDLLLEQLWRDRRQDYRAWSRRAAEHLQSREAEHQQLESLYHWLLADPERGADLVRNRGTHWHNTFQYEWLEALVRLGLEHDAAGRLAGRARGWIYYR
jgi:ATP/maltotriose-dependent transcriptional regulator MalT